MPSMTPAELAQFLERSLVASFCTVSPNGSPKVTPVWFVHAEGKFFCWIDIGSVKAENLARNPKVALCIATHDEPYRYVTIEGTARVIRDCIESRALAISVRYYGEARGRAYATDALSFKDSLIVEITPTKLLTESAA